MTFQKQIQEQRDYIISLRRWFHQHPESSMKEFITSDRIKQELTAMKIPWTEALSTGIIANIYGKENGPVIALRADMDALEVTEENEIPYKSHHEGLMHACGHDGHMASLLGAARVLNAVRDQLKGTVRLIFQPAEENASGAVKMIQTGCMNDVDTVFGLHLWADIPCGRISVQAGPRMAASDIVEVTFYGKGGHGSLPNQCVDATLVGAAFMMNIQAMVSRETALHDPIVFSVGKFESGTRFNVISDRAVLTCTTRCFSRETQKRINDTIKRYADHTAAAYGARASVKYTPGTLSVINEEASARRAERTVRKCFGEEALCIFPKLPASEDFSFFLEEVPGLFALVGAGRLDGEEIYPHHHARFDIDENSMLIAAELTAQYAWDYLMNT